MTRTYVITGAASGIGAATADLTSVDNTHVCGQVIFVDGGSDVVIWGDSTF